MCRRTRARYRILILAVAAKSLEPVGFPALALCRPSGAPFARRLREEIALLAGRRGRRHVAVEKAGFLIGAAALKEQMKK
jgi:hypothetical protein